MEVATAASSTTKPPPSAVSLDLNELSSSSSTSTSLTITKPLPPHQPNSLSVVLAYITRPRLPALVSAEFPGDFNGSDCVTCGLPEVTKQMVVCDGCERGFHLDCTGIGGNKKQAVDAKVVDDWMCAECVRNAVPCDRWPLGFKVEAPGTKSGSSALPLIKGAAAGTDDLPDSRKHSPSDNTFGGDRFGVPVSYLKLLHGENGSSFKEASDVVTPCFKLDFGDRLLHLQKAPSIFGEVNLHSYPEVLREGHLKGVRMRAQSPEEIHLEALREYVLERQGKLDEGWSVELKPSRNSDEPRAIYCSPDGTTFQLMSEVACYLGLIPKRGRKRTNEYASLEIGKKMSKRRKNSRLSAATQCPSKENSSTSQTVGSGGKSGNGVNETGGDESNNLDVILPLQLEDFFILSFGKIDLRPAYHSVDRIWPVGYKSYWHDKITGSVFVSEVSEGDDSGPTFIVRRCSCSELAIPSASTVLCKANLGQSDGKNEEKIVEHDEDYNVARFLAESSPPGEHDVLSCLSSSFNECPDLRTSNDVQPESLPSCGRSDVPFSNLLWEDLIGEFSVVESSASSAWRGVSKKFNDIWNAIYKEKGDVRFFCKHVAGGTLSSPWDVTHESCEDQFAPFAKFCGSMKDLKFPSMVQDDKQMQICSEFLVDWLDQDRSGLDMEFVQEFIEQLPGASACLRYIVCNKRSSPSSSLRIGNGILQTKQKVVGLTRYEETIHTLPSGHKSPKEQMGEDLVMKSPSFPPGKPISTRLPPQCVGNTLEVHEFLCRFHEVLELQEPLLFEELEEELIHPCFGGLDLLEKTGRGNKESQDRVIHSGGSSWHTLSLDSGPAVSAETPHAFVPTESRGLREAAEDWMTSVANDRSISYGLSKAHKSLLKVLISEFQLRVSAVIDPNTDGDFKPKRGRKKDTDIWTTGQLSKFNMLPINELTWPEMVRRYILAFSSMGYDLLDTNTRETAKIFRCLQGDGGILCGSKTGVLGKEEDAKLLAGAIKRIYGSLDGDGDILYMESTSDETSSCMNIEPSDFHVPEWVKVLEPVRKLPTNVGARIRNRINEALKLGPPEWAKIQLELSISKGVYKGNASGPTKQAVIKVLAEVSARSILPNPERQKLDCKQRKKFALVSEIVMKKCRSILRLSVAGGEKNILRRKLINATGNDDEGSLKSTFTISRPLDFRIIDLRLAAGAYGESHEAFLEDVRELWKSRQIAHANQTSLVELAGELSSNFESLFEQEVLTLFRRLLEYSKLESLTADSKKDVEELLSSMKETPKAFWEEGVCKVCGIDKDDKSVLLCDVCDAEYHTYCLNPPLFRIPKGNWYCPSCETGERIARDAPEGSRGISEGAKVELGKVARNCFDSLTHLASVLEEKEYPELSAEERILVLKFLCDELLNSSLFRHHLDHLEQSSNTSLDNLIQKVDSLSAELKNLNSKEKRLASRAGKADKSSQDFVVDAPIVNELTSAESDNDVMLSRDNAPPLDRNEPQTDNLELASIRKEIELLENRRFSIQRQLASLSLRKEFLGSDFNGRLYWGFSESGTHRVVVNDANSSCCPWVYYQSDSQIYELTEYLKANDPYGRKLRDSILEWKQRGFKGSRQGEIQPEKPEMASTRPEECEKFVPSTVAATFLQTKYGPFSEVEATGNLKSSKKPKASTKLKMFRCECLEPVYPSRHHCIFCHRTFFTVMEFEGHNDGKCNLISSLSVSEKSTENAQEVNIGGVVKSQNDEGCPFSFEAICSKFLIETSNTQLVREIGLIGSNGIPDFVPPGPSHNTDPALVLASPEDLKLQSDKQAADQLSVSESEKITNDFLKCAMAEVTEAPEANDIKSVEKPLVGKARQILIKLKMDLLDMEAALPEEGKRPYRSSSKRRWGWRAFVKSAESIYEMVQATIVLEDMIKTEYLKKMWWHWSSLSAAARISTLSHLALRIYSLDSAIDYEKVLVSSSRSAERNKQGRKPNNQKKEPEA